jgi:hypothetical protein
METKYFVFNHKIIFYDKNNLIKYIKLLEYIRHNITENISHIFETYFIDVICNII